MALALILLVGATVLGWATGGRWSALADVHLRGSRLVVAVVGAQLLGDGFLRLTGVHAFYPAGLVVSALAGLAFCRRNLAVMGVPLIALGLTANALVVAANGAMPVSRSAATRADISIRHIARGRDPRHEVVTPATHLEFLADVIPVPAPRRPEVASAGDVLIAAGLGQWVFVGMRLRRRRRSGSDDLEAETPEYAADPTTSEDDSRTVVLT